MPVVRVILREGQEKVYHAAQASIHTPDRTLRITRNHASIAAFPSEYSHYWEYVEDTGVPAVTEQKTTLLLSTALAVSLRHKST